MPIKIRYAAPVVGLLATAWLVYIPGLTGPFLFDDFFNLDALGARGPIESWELLKAYLTSGAAGPTGRPIALASFLIDANDWPADPEPFKRTNLLIHLLIGFLLLFTLRRLLQAIGRDRFEVEAIALIATALWLLNPYLVSTTLYVVQRMTQISALFVLLGLWGYLLGRSWLPEKPLKGYATITLAVVVGTLLAVLSKENGILLPVLVLTIEFALRHHWSQPGPDWRWMAIFLWAPALVVLYYLAMRLPGADVTLPTRGWSILERLLTQPRMIWDYLFHLFIPQTQTRGLYQDGIVVSSNLVTPRTTLPALVGLLALLGAGLLSRRRWPLFSLAVLFFLAGHLIESTTIALEMHFEHRNYLPAVFLFLPIASGLLLLRHRVKPTIVIGLSLVLVSSFALATWQRASLWGDEKLLLLVWAENNPKSPRAQLAAAQIWLRQGQALRALNHLERSMAVMPESAILTVNYLAFRLQLGDLEPEELKDGTARLYGQPLDAQLLTGLRHLVDSVNARGAAPEHAAIVFDLLSHFASDDPGTSELGDRYAIYLKGLLQSGQGDPQGAMRHFDTAFARYSSVETGFNIVSVLGAQGHYEEALQMLDKTEELLLSEAPGPLLRGQGTYLAEVARIREALEEDRNSIEP